jgi:hypothetical protein
MDRTGWRATALALAVATAACGGTHGATRPPATETTAASRADLATLRTLLARLSDSGAPFDATYALTNPDGSTSGYRLVRAGTRARFENTALGQHVVVIVDGDRGWRCTGAAGAPATSCAAEPVPDFDTRYDPRHSAALLPDLLGVGGGPVTTARVAATIAGEPVDCVTFSQARTGRHLSGRLCVTADGVLAADDFGAQVQLVSLSRTVDPSAVAPPAAPFLAR